MWQWEIEWKEEKTWRNKEREKDIGMKTKKLKKESPKKVDIQKEKESKLERDS